MIGYNVKDENRGRKKERSAMTDDQFGKLLDFFNLSRRGYRKVRKGVQKRVVRHMRRLGVSSFAAYLKLLEEDPEIRKECETLLTVSISRFFRDVRLWEVLENTVLPDIMQGKNVVNVWSAGCACGEEAYSFKIIWEQVKKKRPSLPRLKLLATDMSQLYIVRAKAGIYGISSLKEVPDTILKTYFCPCENRDWWKVKDDLKRSIDWLVHDLLDDPPGSDFDLIFLRNNLLTYYNEAVKLPALEKILKALKPGGILIKGAHENIPKPDTGLVRTEFHPHIYRKETSCRSSAA